MPTIGNGYLGATIYDDAVYLNGVYEGTGGYHLFIALFFFCFAEFYQSEQLVEHLANNMNDI